MFRDLIEAKLNGQEIDFVAVLEDLEKDKAKAIMHYRLHRAHRDRAPHAGFLGTRYHTWRSGSHFKKASKYAFKVRKADALNRYKNGEKDGS